jgi:putative DNA primase/helicase
VTTIQPRLPRWLERYATPKAQPKGPPAEGALGVQQWNIPPRLRYAQAWAVWKYEQENNRWSKPPYIPPALSPDGGRELPPEKAEPSDASTWRSFEQALRAFQDDRQWDGISFALDHRWGVVGVDLDHVSEHRADAARIVKDLASYTEHTPGRDGLRIFVLGQLPEGRRRREWVEMYDQRRFLTVTGQHVDGTPTDIKASSMLYSTWQRWLQGGMRPEKAPWPTN